ncbi:MAG TPA: ATP-dependent DNA helicase RecG [Bacteroidota bacterium]|nr:ATP-dependent DNA helicase RecG [Bacteroidota bacterium]
MPANAQPSSDVLTQPIQFLKGIGPKRAVALEKYGIRTVHDLLFHVPRRYLDRTDVVKIGELRKIASSSAYAPPMAEASADTRRDVTVVGDVRSFRLIGAKGKARLIMVLGDQTGTVQCVWFGGVQYWRSAFRIGELLAVSGQPTLYGGVLQFVHPDIDKIREAETATETDNDEKYDDVDWSKTYNTGGLVPLYPSGQDLARVGFDSAGFRRAIHRALEASRGRIQDFLPMEILTTRSLRSLAEALEGVHMPRSTADLPPSLHRLKYQEFFLFQLKLALTRRERRSDHSGIVFATRSPLARQLVDALPFELTRAQVRVIREISADMAADHPMNRLLQGDVGSGKTIVALLAMLIAADNGYQSAFLAPTEVLAEQHYATLTSLLGTMPVIVRLLVGAQRSVLRREILEDIREGRASIVVGTHALLEKDVAFHRLGFVVIDEQHRFGVLQRAAIRGKGTNPDVLVMTATPIPRTLSLTLYGDLDVSVINEMPKDRQRIQTLLRDDDARKEVYEFVREQVRKGRQAYFVYPLIEDSESVELKAATTFMRHLQGDVFPELRVGLLHGRMPSAEKESVMAAFKSKACDILVATTVIEVGIDVPNATVMVVEDAERFGLSQLHQLRGRVGRGAEQSYCILLTKRWIAQRSRRTRRAADPSEEEHRLAERRLASMVATTDGFQIAEMDLRLRGPGDYFGTRQSGIPEFKVANILADTELLDLARNDAFALAERDPLLEDSRHAALRKILREQFSSESSLASAG